MMGYMDVMAMGYFDFVGLIRILRDKGYELSLYFGERDDIHIQLTCRDLDTIRTFNVKKIVSLNAIEQYKNGPNYALCNIFLGLMEQLDRRKPAFNHYMESIGDQDGK